MESFPKQIFFNWVISGVVFFYIQEPFPYVWF